MVGEVSDDIVSIDPVMVSPALAPVDPVHRPVSAPGPAPEPEPGPEPGPAREPGAVVSTEVQHRGPASGFSTGGRAGAAPVDYESGGFEETTEAPAPDPTDLSYVL